MVSDKPLPDRCGAKITDSVGIEVTIDVSDGEQMVLTEETVAGLQFVLDDDIVHGESVYKSVREYLWADHELTHLALSDHETALALADDDHETSETIPAEPSTTVGAIVDDAIWLDVAGIVENVTNSHSEHAGYCERYPMLDADHERCYDHQPGPGAPEGNTNALTHGLRAQRTNFYKQLPDEDKQFVEALVDSWIEQSPYDRDNVGVVNELYRTAIDQLRAWSAIDEYVEHGTYVGLVKEQDVEMDGEMITLEDEHPVNLPYSRLDRDIQSKLKDLNVYESPESEAADSTESLAQALSGLTDE